MKDCVGSDTKSDAEERDVDDGTEDMQGDLSTGNSCEELQEGDISILCIVEACELFGVYC